MAERSLTILYSRGHLATVPGSLARDANEAMTTALNAYPPSKRPQVQITCMPTLEEGAMIFEHEGFDETLRDLATTTLWPLVQKHTPGLHFLMREKSKAAA